MSLLSVAYTQAAGLLNDPVQLEWTDAVMLPRAKKAHVELQVRLYEFGLSVMKEVTADITVTAGLDELPTPPADLIEPIFLKEKAVAAADSTYIDMDEKSYIPHVAEAATIRYWAWREEKVKLMKATANRVVQMRYTKGLAALTSGTSPIGVIFGEAFMGPRIASICYQSVVNSSILHLTNGLIAY